MLAQTFPVEAIKVSGDNEKRINLVILSEGYQMHELDDFITHATNFSNDMFSQSPFLEYADYFNVYAIRIPSIESGADHPATATDVTEPASPTKNVDTYFNATFDSFGFHRLLFYEIDGNNANNTQQKINMVLANNFPEYDQALILVNSTVYGGSGGQFPMASNATSASEIAIHELGHSLFDLKDEYYPGDILAAEAINMTRETDPTLIKWKNWLGTNSIGIYPYGASGEPAKWYKPHQTCKMQFLGVPFCAVCKEGIIEKIHDLVSPIDEYSPFPNTITASGSPLDFKLNLIKPTANTLQNTWMLNTVTIANDVDDISLTESQLTIGINTLTAIVTDVTPLLKVDNHETIHVNAVTWTINYSTTLGIEDISSVKHNFNIKVFPNPTQDIVNFKIESNAENNLKIDIVSIDGKQLKSLTIFNAINSQIDLSNFTNGIYIANFYSGNTLIASKKLIKN